MGAVVPKSTGSINGTRKNSSMRRSATRRVLGDGGGDFWLGGVDDDGVKTGGRSW